MRSSIGSIVSIGLVVAFAAGCSDVSQPLAPTRSAPSSGVSFARQPQRIVGPPFNLPAVIERPGGAHFELGCFFDGTGCFYAPVNDAAVAFSPHGLTLAGVPIP